MTLREFIENVKIERMLSFDTDKVIKYVTDEAKKKAVNGVGYLGDDEVLNLVLEYKEEPKKEEKKNEAADQLQLF